MLKFLSISSSDIFVCEKSGALENKLRCNLYYYLHYQTQQVIIYRYNNIMLNIKYNVGTVTSRALKVICTVVRH